MIFMQQMQRKANIVCTFFKMCQCCAPEPDPFPLLQNSGYAPSSLCISSRNVNFVKLGKTETKISNYQFQN